MHITVLKNWIECQIFLELSLVVISIRSIRAPRKNIVHGKARACGLWKWTSPGFFGQAQIKKKKKKLLILRFY